MKQYTYLSLFLCFLATSCVSHKNHTTSSYDTRAKDHRTIAILPITTSSKNMPSGITEAEKEELLLEKNLAIQKTITNQIARRTGREKGDIQITVKSIQSTNKLLKDRNITHENIEEIDEQTLSQILDVDAVLRTSVYTDRILVDNTSDKIRHILDQISIIPNLGTTERRVLNADVEDIVVKSEIVDLKSAEPIWTYRKTHNIKVRDKSSQIVDQIATVIARRFPYRQD